MPSLLRITGSRKPFVIEYESFRQGSKNAALLVIGASLLFDTDLAIGNVPHIFDLLNVLGFFKKINVNFTYENNEFIKRKNNKFKKIVFGEDFFNTRGGFYLIAALINKWKEIKIKGYGIAGCKIGERGYGNIFKVFSEFGIDSDVVGGDLIMRKNNKYTGKKIILNDLGICVSGVALILASQFMRRTTFVGTGKAPEINDLISFLSNNGVYIKKGKHNHLVVYKKRINCHKNRFNIQDDRMVIATYAVLALISSGVFTIKTSKLKYLHSFIELLKLSGCRVEKNKKIRTTVISRGKKMKPLEVIIDDYPHIPTDLQAIVTVFLCTISGVSTIKDNIFPQRNHHIYQLKKMNQDIDFNNKKIIIKGGKKFIKNKLTGHDIRCNAALILAACIAKGTTSIVDWEYVNRGYENILNIVGRNRKLIIE